MTASDLLADLTRRGISVVTHHGMRVRVLDPAGLLTDDDRLAIRGNLRPLLALVGGCPHCGRAIDRRQHCCWRCHWRPCVVCGKDTASAFIATCLRCQFGDRP